MNGKHIVLCVTGGIAAFKAAALTSKLTQRGAIVRVIMTEAATQFVTPLTFQSLSRQPVYTDTFDEKDPERIAHIDLADWADLVLVAPATANTIAKLAHGFASDMVTTTLLATKAPVYIAPAMNVNMIEHPAVIDNLSRLEQMGVHFIQPGEGQLACGWVGKGRLAEPEDILEIVEKAFCRERELPFTGQHVVITAGPTQERIDPVRYITNDSSGKMGYALARVARELGAKVTLISGPVSLDVPTGVNVVHVTSTEDMLNACLQVAKEADVMIKCAAVSDFTPVEQHEQKMKKTNHDELVLRLRKTPDILSTLGGHKRDDQVLVGFAAETNDIEHYATKKLQKKRADMIVANDVSKDGVGFGHETSAVTIYDVTGGKTEVPFGNKLDVARAILDQVLSLQGKRIQP